jgi:hypothetical protein
MTIVKELALWAFLLLFLGLSGVSSVLASNSQLNQVSAEPAQTLMTQNLYSPTSAPYCQIYTTRFNFWKLSTEIIKFSTFKLNPCLQEELSKLSMASVVAQLRTIVGTSHAYKNGPSYFTMDSNLSPVNREFIFIGPLKFFAQSITEVSLIDMLFKTSLLKQGIPLAYFTPFTTHEDIYFIWNKGTTIYVLVPPNGKGFYVMTSYSTMIDNQINKSNIFEKVSSLNLPKGWIFESRTLEQPLIVRTLPTQAFSHQVIFDPLQNFYHFVE